MNETISTARPDIRRLCREDGITQKQLAAELGVTPATISNIARGKHPSWEMAQKLRNHFGANRCPLEGWE